MNYEVIDLEQFKKHLKILRTSRSIRIFFDIETYQYNEDMGREKPTLYKNCVYSVAISYFFKDRLYIVAMGNFKDLFDSILDVYKGYKITPRIELIAHNNNKYDNHFLRNDLIYYYNMKVENLYLNNASEEGNHYSYRLKDLTDRDKEGVILEKRVKSKNNLELDFFLEGIQFKTLDNFMKTHSSIASLGKRLLRGGYITEEELKTDFNYTKYNLNRDLTEIESRTYATNIFNNLNYDELNYIYNDVIILAYSVRYYSNIFKGFDYNKITFTSNILESYNINDLTSFQLLKSLGKGKHKVELNYTDYSFSGENLYDYLKSFYNGGLNFYNDKYVGKIIDEKVFGMDINSSYPYSMHSQKIPTFLNSWEEFEEETEISIKEIEKEEDTFTLYRISRMVFDDYIITNIKSKVIKQMLVKYYSKNEYININSWTFKMIENISGLSIDKLPVISYIKWDCVWFGARNILEDYYRIKTQGQNKKILNMDSLYNIYETEEETDYIYTDEEIDISKLNLNGLYGIPALRPYFNLFRWHGTELQNVENGFNNSQRNVLFSVFVTSVSLYNLLDPLSYLTAGEIDECFLYCDTDSLYFKKYITSKFPNSLFDPNNLGAWDIQNECIDKFYTLNHKKYCYLENGKIEVKAGGVPQEAFNTDMGFDEFIETQFKHGIEISNQKSIFNEQGTISIYPSITELDKGTSYRTYSYDPDFIEKKKELLYKAKIELDGMEEEGLYIESNIGCFSITELYPVIHDNDLLSINFYNLKEKYIKNELINISI